MLMDQRTQQSNYSETPIMSPHVGPATNGPARCGQVRGATSRGSTVSSVSISNTARGGSGGGGGWGSRVSFFSCYIVKGWTCQRSLICHQREVTRESGLIRALVSFTLQRNLRGENMRRARL